MGLLRKLNQVRIDGACFGHGMLFIILTITVMVCAVQLIGGLWL